MIDDYKPEKVDVGIENTETEHESDIL